MHIVSLILSWFRNRVERGWQYESHRLRGHGRAARRLIVFHTEQIIFAEVLQNLQYRASRERSVASEQLNERIFLKKLFRMLLQTVSFIGFIAADRILCKDKIEVVNEHIEQMDCRVSGRLRSR